jgi:hypothetical protein
MKEIDFGERFIAVRKLVRILGVYKDVTPIIPSLSFKTSYAAMLEFR